MDPDRQPEEIEADDCSDGLTGEWIEFYGNTPGLGPETIARIRESTVDRVELVNA